MASVASDRQQTRQKIDTRQNELTPSADSGKRVRVGICDSSPTVRLGLETMLNNAAGIEV